VEAFRALANCMQDKLIVQEYQEKFHNTVDVFQATAGADALANHHGMHKYIMSTDGKYAYRTCDKLSDAARTRNQGL
jgi:hypothetical protein